MRVQKLSLHDFEEVTTQNLLEIKGGGGGGCCCQPFSNDGMVQAFNSYMYEIGQDVGNAWDQWTTNAGNMASDQWEFTKAAAEGLINLTMPSPGPILDLPYLYDNGLPDLGGNTTASNCGGGGGGGGGEPVYRDIGYSPGRAK